MIRDAEYTEQDRAELDLINRAFMDQIRDEQWNTAIRTIGLVLFAVVFLAGLWPWLCGFVEIAQVWARRFGL